MLRFLYGRLLWNLYNPRHRQSDYFDIVMEYETSLFLNVDSRSFVEWWLFFYDEYEPDITNIIKRLFRTGFVAVDVGANIGMYTLVMASQAGDEGRVFAFEPQERNCNRLLENIALNSLRNIEVARQALSDAPGEMVLYSPAPTSINQMMPSFYRQNFDPTEEGVTGLAVPVATLDRMWEQAPRDRLDFLKIDTEGHDYKVIMGARQTIARFRPHIVFEYNQRLWQDQGVLFEDVQGFLSDLGYSLYVIRWGYMTQLAYGLPAYANIFAAPRPLG